MPKFDSALGSKSFVGQPMREFDVPDETDAGMSTVMKRRGPSLHGPQDPVDIAEARAYEEKFMHADAADIERQIRAAREDRASGRERINDGAKRRIEMLVGMTRSTRQVTVEDKVYVLQTLRSKEMREAMMEASVFDNTVQSPFEIRRQLLARSLTQIAGVDIEQFIGSRALDDKLSLIDALDEPLLNRLYSEYTTLITEARKRYAIKSEEDVKELAEDLKK
jgi:hypothetical protein